MGNRVEFTKNSLSPALKDLPAVLNRNIYQVMRYHEPQIRSEARGKAPWTDRTSNARSGLDAKVVVPRTHVYELVLFGRVSYQIFLEVRWSGRYAIIMPTIRAYTPKVVGSLHKLLERMNIKAGD